MKNERIETLIFKWAPLEKDRLRMSVPRQGLILKWAPRVLFQGNTVGLPFSMKLPFVTWNSTISFNSICER